MKAACGSHLYLKNTHLHLLAHKILIQVAYIFQNSSSKRYIVAIPWFEFHCMQPEPLFYGDISQRCAQHGNSWMLRRHSVLGISLYVDLIIPSLANQWSILHVVATVDVWIQYWMLDMLTEGFCFHQWAL